MGIGIFNKLKRFGRGFVSGIKDSQTKFGRTQDVLFNDPKVKDAVTNAVDVAKNNIVNVVKNANVILDKNKLLKGLSTETKENNNDLTNSVVSFASRKWIPKFK